LQEVRGFAVGEVRFLGVFLSLGANLGDRTVQLRKALAALAAQPRITPVRVSRLYETEPVGHLNQPLFLNAVVEIKTDLDPLELLNAVKGIETELGRVPGERWGPRHIDIDIVLWGPLVLRTEQLTIPHERFRERAFVLCPLAELADDAVDPVTGRSIGALLAERGQEGIAVFGPLEIP